jgi:hypothetical protein
LLFIIFGRSDNFNESEDDLQRAVNRLENITDIFIMRIPSTKTRTMAFRRRNHARCKIVVDNNTIEEVPSFNYLGFNVSYSLKEDVNI